MKPYHKMDLLDKAKLLHQLFPDEMPQLLGFLKGVCATILENEQTGESKQLLQHHGRWLPVAKDLHRRIEQYGERLHDNASLFADQLFDGLDGYFVQECIKDYVTIKVLDDQQYIQAVQLLFGTDKNFLLMEVIQSNN